MRTYKITHTWHIEIEDDDLSESCAKDLAKLKAEQRQPEETVIEALKALTK